MTPPLSSHAVLLRARNLTRHYRQGERRVAVLSGLDLDIAEGECLALLGRSGCGKSTLLNLLGGVDLADEGDILLRGRSLNALGEPARSLFRRRHIGYVYQFFNLIPTLTVAENIALPAELNALPVSTVAKRVGELLARIGLEGRERAYPDQLSGGEQQRVAIARALIHEPDLVLADEPTGNLDAETGWQVLGLLRELFAPRGRTLLLVTHSLDVAESADRVLILENGRLRPRENGPAW